MPPSTVVGLIILVVAVAPGLVYTLTFERQVSGYGVTLADRTFRFIAVSAIFHLFAAWPEYWLYRVTWGRKGEILGGQFALLWCGAILLLLLPAVAGFTIGGLYRTRTTREGWSLIRRLLTSSTEKRLLRFILGAEPAPRAWDDLFSQRPTVYLRVITPEEKIIAGLFASRSYAAGFPQAPDLLLEDAWSVDEQTGELQESLGYPVYIASSQIGRVEVIPQQDPEETT